MHWDWCFASEHLLLLLFMNVSLYRAPPVHIPYEGSNKSPE